MDLYNLLKTICTTLYLLYNPKCNVLFNILTNFECNVLFDVEQHFEIEIELLNCTMFIIDCTTLHFATNFNNLDLMSFVDCTIFQPSCCSIV